MGIKKWNQAHLISYGFGSEGIRGSLGGRGDGEGVAGGNSRGAPEHRWPWPKCAFMQRYLHVALLKRRKTVMKERDRNDPWLGSRREMKKESRETGMGSRRKRRV